MTVVSLGAYQFLDIIEADLGPQYTGGGREPRTVTARLTTAMDEPFVNLIVTALLSEEAQRYFADETYEIPVADGVEPHEGVPTLDHVDIAGVDLNELDDLAGTLTLLTELGIL